MTRFILVSTLVVLATAAPAAAKSVQAVEICGESECTAVPGGDLQGHRAFDWVFGGGTGVGGETLPAGAAAWRATVNLGHGEVLRQTVAPGTGYIRLDDAMGSSYGTPRWERMSSTAAAKWEELTQGVAPLERATPDGGGDAAAAGAAGASTAGASDGLPVWPLALIAGLGLVATMALWRRRSG